MEVVIKFYRSSLRYTSTSSSKTDDESQTSSKTVYGGEIRRLLPVDTTEVRVDGVVVMCLVGTRIGVTWEYSSGTSSTGLTSRPTLLCVSELDGFLTRTHPRRNRDPFMSKTNHQNGSICVDSDSFTTLKGRTPGCLQVRGSPSSSGQGPCGTCDTRRHNTGPPGSVLTFRHQGYGQ